MKLFSKKFANTIPYPAQDVSPVRQAAKIPEIVLHTHTTSLNVRRNGCRTGEVWSWDCEDCGDSSLGVYMHEHEAARSATEHAHNHLIAINPVTIDRETGEPINDKE